MPGCRRKTMSKQSTTRNRGGRKACQNLIATLTQEHDAKRRLFRVLVALAIFGRPRSEFFEALVKAKEAIGKDTYSKVWNLLHEVEHAFYDAARLKYPLPKGDLWDGQTMKRRFEMAERLIKSQFAVAMEERVDDLGRFLGVIL